MTPEWRIVAAILAAPTLAVGAYRLSDGGREAARPATTAANPDGGGTWRVALDCNRPQGHHRWTGDMITPQNGTVMRVSTGDSHEDIDIKGWLCVIDAERPTSDASRT